MSHGLNTAMATRSGLVSYPSGSEISDSEDEGLPTGNTPPTVTVHGLGIPTSKSHQSSTPPSFMMPVVHTSAPNIGLVPAYEDEEELNDSKDNTEDVFVSPAQILNSENSTAHPLPSLSHQSGGDVPAIEITDDSLQETEDADSTRPLFLPLSKVQLPPEPPGRCSTALQEKIVALLEKKNRLGLDLNKNVQARKDFRNPSIYDKLVQFCNLDEFGTNYPEHLFNPKEWGEESYYDNLLKAQKKAYEKKEKAKLGKVEFVTGTKRPAAASTVGTTTGQEPPKKQRKSKWDVSTESTGSRGSSPSKEKTSGVGAQALAQASQLNKELSKLAK